MEGSQDKRTREEDRVAVAVAVAAAELPGFLFFLFLYGFVYCCELCAARNERDSNTFSCLFVPRSDERCCCCFFFLGENVCMAKGCEHPTARVGGVFCLTHARDKDLVKAHARERATALVQCFVCQKKVIRKLATQGPFGTDTWYCKHRSCSDVVEAADPRTNMTEVADMLATTFVTHR